MSIAALPAAAEERGQAPAPADVGPAEAPPATPPEQEPSPVEAVAGWGEGLGLRTIDGAFSMQLRARAQVRATVVVPEDDVEEASADFMIRRARLGLDASGWHGLVKVRVQLAFAPLDQDPNAPSPLRDAFVTFAPLRDLVVRAGQMKVPFGRQRVVSSGALQMVDRSIVTGELNLDRDVGMQIFSDDLLGLDGWLGYALGVFGGDGRNRVSGGYGLLYAARLALRPAGGARGDDLDEVDFERSERAKLTLAGSAAFNHDTDRQRSTIGPVFEHGPWADYWHAGGDVSFKWRGLSMTGEAFLRRALEERRTLVVDGEEITDETRSGFGGFFQVGQLLGEHVELSARVGTLRPLGDAGGMQRENELGGALSYYVLRHTLKVQADAFYLFDQWGDGRVQARLQLQVFP
jgi:phosphate-selective porin OprO and OprP